MQARVIGRRCAAAGFLVLASLAGGGLALGQDPLTEPGGRSVSELVALLQEAEIGREKIVIRAGGWISEGSFDLLGTRSGEYRMERTATSDGLRVLFTSKSGGKEDRGSLVLTGTEFVVTSEGSKREKRGTIDPSREVVVFENLVWASFVDIGRALEKLESEGKLLPGVKLTALLLSGGVAFDIEVTETEVRERSVKNRSEPLRTTRFLLPPKLQCSLISTKDDQPVRIEVPAQQITVSAVGYEELQTDVLVPTSIVDSGPWRDQLSRPTHEVTVERKVMMAMRDGVELAADIYRPKGAGKFPTILTRTPYNRQSEGALKGPYYAKRGYVCVAQDVRGRFESGGAWFPFSAESADGADTLTWIAKQTWSDGQVGMVGASYVGLVQWLAAKTGHPALKCIVPQVSPPDPHENFPYEGGAFLLGAAWWARVLLSLDKGTDFRTGLDWLKALSALPLSDLDQAMKLDQKSFLSEWIAHPPHDRDYWEKASYQDSYAKIDIPVFNVTGWYDGDMPGAIQNFPGMRKGAKSTTARASQYLVVGPWTHIFNSSRTIGEVDFGSEGVIDLDARILRFFDRYLKGVLNGIDQEPPVHVFTMGSNRWSAEADWPLPETQYTKLFLASEGQTQKRDGGGRLLQSPPTSGLSSETFKYDPKDLPKSNVDFSDLSEAQATADLRKDEDRADDLEYTSAPLAAACEILGPMTIVLHVSTDAVDTDFTAGLVRILPDGKMIAVRGGIQRLRYAKDPRAEHLVKPGSAVEIHVDLWATGQRLEKGERLQVSVGSSGWPAYARHMNTLESPLTATESVVAVNTIYHDALRASYVLLPVIPRADAPGLKFEAAPK